MKMVMDRIIKGGFLADKRAYITSGVGILSAVGAYLVGDGDIFGMLQTIFTLGGIYFLRKASEQKGDNNGQDSRKISE
ncbi:hypothetical protein HDR63_03135 [bacterium]|nr:hypothetical protein [bacterium]